MQCFQEKSPHEAHIKSGNSETKGYSRFAVLEHRGRIKKRLRHIGRRPMVKRKVQPEEERFHEHFWL